MPLASPAIAACERCNGTGQYHGTRRDGSAYIGRCFACQGYRPSGYRSYRTGAVAAPVALAPAPEGSPMPVLGIARGQDALRAFKAAHPAEYDWLTAQAAAGVNFAASLLSGLQRYGNLTPRQLAAVQRNLGQVEASMVDAAVEPAIGTGLDGQPVTESQMRAGTPVSISSLIPARPAPLGDVIGRDLVTIDMGQIFTAFDAAAASGLRKVRLTLGEVELRRTGERFRFGSGNVMVYTRGTYRGYVSRDNVFHLGTGRHMGPSDLNLVQTICADPLSAARTHGQDTGRCACCGRLLTDPVSVMQSIGPICLRRFFPSVPAF